MFLLVLLFGLIRCEDEVKDINQDIPTTEEQTSAFPAQPTGDIFHFQSFQNEDYKNTWTPSKLENYSGVWQLRESAKPTGFPGEKMIYMSEGLKYYGLSTQFPEPLVLTDKTLVFQYEVRLEDSLNCGGAYMKLFGKDNYSPDTLSNETRYVIMFGPDKCGSNNKVHFIFRHKNPISGEVEEKHLKDSPSIETGKLNSLYTLIVRPDNSFEILINGNSVKQGNLLQDFVPPVNPPKEIDDPTDTKPSDWVDDETMDDPDAVKPEDWDETQPEFIKDPAKINPPEGWLVDEPKFINDPEAQKPEDWDDDIHGEWEAPTIPNPKCEAAPGCGPYEAPLIKNELYKGKWIPPKIPNPAYKGQWKPRQIPNPNYFEDAHPHNFPEIIGAGYELWTVDKNIGFSNVLITTDETVVHQWNKVHFIPKHKIQEQAEKKLEAENSPKKKSSAGFGNALKEFGSSISDAWMNLYTENQALTIAITSVACVIPLILIFACFCRGNAQPAPRETHAQPAPKVEEVENEPEVKPEPETKSEENEQEPEQEQEPEPEQDAKQDPETENEQEQQPSPKKKKSKKPDNF